MGFVLGNMLIFVMHTARKDAETEDRPGPEDGHEEDESLGTGHF